jgi:hypothetical protein
MAINGKFEVDGITIPLQVKLKKGNTWVLGSDTTWADSSEMASVSEKGVIGGRSQDIYTFYWQWPYESQTTSTAKKSRARVAAADTANADTADTYVGDKAVEGDIIFDLNIETHAEAEPAVVTPSVTTEEPKTQIIRSIVRVPKQVVKRVLAKVKKKPGYEDDGTYVGTYGAPKTSDAFAYIFWIAVLLGMAGIIILLVRKHKKRKKQVDANA